MQFSEKPSAAKAKEVIDLLIEFSLNFSFYLFYFNFSYNFFYFDFVKSEIERKRIFKEIH
jgi:hypothetical protein